jgi:hypothetical protein
MGTLVKNVIKYVYVTHLFVFVVNIGNDNVKFVLQNQCNIDKYILKCMLLFYLRSFSCGDDIKYFLLDEILDVRKRANMPSTANAKRETKNKNKISCRPRVKKSKNL